MATVTIGTTEYQAFADVEFADDWLAADVQRAAPWALRNDDAKGRGLVRATRMLLALPGIETPTYDAPGDVVEQVTAMLASDLLAKPAIAAGGGGASNVKSAKAGSAQVEFFSPVDGGPVIPVVLWDMLVAAGLLGSTGGGDGSMEGAFITGISGGCRPWLGRYADDWPGFGLQAFG